jgi:hypothetical protein
MKIKFKSLNIQFQPERARNLSIERVKKFFHEFTKYELASLNISEGDDDGPYINFLFEANDVYSLIEKIDSKLYSRNRFSRLLSNSIIMTCEGEHGWDDYSLLHHFDKNVPLSEYC